MSLFLEICHEKFGCVRGEGTCFVSETDVVSRNVMASTAILADLVDRETADVMCLFRGVFEQDY